MLLNQRTLAGIEVGHVEAVYRKWSEPRAKPGSMIRTRAGVIEVTSVDEMDPSALTSRDAAGAGYSDVGELLASAGDRGDRLYRIGVRLVGPDPRVALREIIPDEEDLAGVVRSLARLDAASRHGEWTWATLRLIAANPGVRAEDLAHGLDREKKPFKLDVRKLKELGLTESLEVGYRLSPRGMAVLESTERS
jgi:hypothetical protein